MCPCQDRGERLGEYQLISAADRGVRERGEQGAPVRPVPAQRGQEGEPALLEQVLDHRGVSAAACDVGRHRADEALVEREDLGLKRDHLLTLPALPSSDVREHDVLTHVHDSASCSACRHDAALCWTGRPLRAASAILWNCGHRRRRSASPGSLARSQGVE